MKRFRLNEMTRGWFVGNFNPAALKTENFEVGVKSYLAGDKEEAHFHKEAIEITLILEGEVQMNGAHFCGGDIILIGRDEVCEFEAMTDCTTVVVKDRSVAGDKYIDVGRYRVGD